MAAYQLTANGAVIRVTDGAFIPNDLRNTDFQQYQAWLAAGNIPDPVPTPTPTQISQAAFGAGCQIVSSGNPAVNGTYPIDPTAVSDVLSEVQFISAYQEFSNGQTTLVWPTTTGTVSLPSTTVAMNIFKALAQYVTAWKQYAAGITTTQPAQPVTIA